MGQNTSSAVMAQRNGPHDSLDDFPTPPWATRAFIEHVLRPAGLSPDLLSAWDPAANRGYMARPLSEQFKSVHASDVHDYGAGYAVHDYLQPYRPDGVVNIDIICTNPPFRLGLQFIERGLEIARTGVAVIMRSAFTEGIERYERLYRDNPPTVIAHHAERVIMTKGIVRDPNKKYWDEAAQKWKRPSSATAYSWLFWIKNCRPQPPVWIPPCRKLLEREGDYA